MTTFDTPATTGESETKVARTSGQTAGWFPDPEGRHDLRYFDGERWTDNVTHRGPSPCTHCGS